MLSTVTFWVFACNGVRSTLDSCLLIKCSAVSGWFYDLLILANAPCFGHECHLPCGICRGRAAQGFGFRGQLNGILGAGRYAQAKPYAPIQVDLGQFTLIHFNGFHLAPFQAGFTAGAFILVHLSEIVGKDHFGRFGVPVQGT
jgi:hypothetical protein